MRRRRVVALRQQQLAQQTQTTELSDVAYVYQYPPPPGNPLGGSYNTPGRQPLYAPPPGAPMSHPGSGGGYYSSTMLGASGQQQPFPQAHMLYPPMPVHQPTGTTSSTSTTYVAAQDGSANLTAAPLSAADVNDGVPAVPPPPYTPTIPK